MAKYCECTEWHIYIDEIINAQKFMRLHGQEYSGKPFKYCPWCGAVLEPVIHSYHRARGAVPWKEGDELPEDVIRRMRDA